MSVYFEVSNQISTVNHWIFINVTIKTFSLAKKMFIVF